MNLPLDAIYYINLDHRDDKRQHIETNVLPYFTGTGTETGTQLSERVERFSAIRHDNGAVGCSLSHLAVARKAKAAKARYYLVFEDDFEFLISSNEFNELLTNLFSVPQLNFKVVMLAYNALQNEPFNDLLLRSNNVQTTSGFIVNCAYIDELISCWENGLRKFLETGEHWNWACDQCWKALQKEKWFITARRVGKQKPAVSDIGKQWVIPEF
jgi:glycosyl transferase family 25